MQPAPRDTYLLQHCCYFFDAGWVCQASCLVIGSVRTWLIDSVTGEAYGMVSIVNCGSYPEGQVKK